MAICRNPNCERSYERHDGIVVVELVRILRVIHDDESREPHPAIIQRLTELTPRIYQTGTHCAACHQPMATLPGPAEAQEVNDLFQNTDLLQMHGVPT